MEPQATDEAGWKAPYVSYETLTNFLEKKLGGGLLPPRIDRGFLDSYAGSVQPILLGTLKTIGFIGEAHEVTDLLRQASSAPEARKEVLRDWAGDFYREQLKLAEQNATAQMLHESFARHKYTGSTLRKAVVFFLALTDDVGLPRSPHFKPPRQAPVTNGSSRGRRSTKEKSAARDHTAPPPAASPGRAERKTVRFGSAGSVTIEVDVRWLDLPDETFTRLRQIVNDLSELEAASSPAGEVPGT